MYGIYREIIAAAEKALNAFDETAELLEYPEVQADKAYYLSVLTKYNELNALREKLDALKGLLDEEQVNLELMQGADARERAVLSEENVSIRREISVLVSELSASLGYRVGGERIFCKAKFNGAVAAKIGIGFICAIKKDLVAHGATLSEEKTQCGRNGVIREASFVADGGDAGARISVFTGVHKVYIASARSEEVAIAATVAARDILPPSEKELKIDLFHSSGAGGQNINKVETAIRVTHIPSGTVVVCQDERSQLKNKRRAIETLTERLRARNAEEEKQRVEGDLNRQLSVKNTPLNFDESGTVTDTRLNSVKKQPLPMSDAEFTAYVDGLIAIGE